MEVKVHLFLTSPLDGDERLTSYPGRFAPGERTPGFTSIGASVGQISKALQRRKKFTPAGDRLPECQARSLITIRTTISHLRSEQGALLNTAQEV